MPIYDATYRRYEARAPLHTVRFWPITREALRLILAKRAFLGLLFVSGLPFIVFAILIYVVTRFPDAARLMPIDGRLFGEFLGWQGSFALLLTVFGGAGLVANDLRTGAILVYLSRPLTRRDYVLGKLSVLLALNLSITLVPALVLYLLGLGLAPGHFLKWSLAWIAPAIVLQSLSTSLVLGLFALAVSSLSRSARVAGLAFFGLVIGLDLVRAILRNVLDAPATVLLSVSASLKALAAVLFGMTDEIPEVHWSLVALTLVAVCLVSLGILRARVRAVEIVR